jgi:hypothetical protein
LINIGLTLCQGLILYVKIVKKLENVIVSGGGDNPQSTIH